VGALPVSARRIFNIRSFVATPPGAENPPISPLARHNPVARTNDGERVLAHCLADIVCRAAIADTHCEIAIGDRAARGDVARHCIEPLRNSGMPSMSSATIESSRGSPHKNAMMPSIAHWTSGGKGASGTQG
jgi:hypothetical protein